MKLSWELDSLWELKQMATMKRTRGTKSQGLDNVTRVADTTVGDDRDAKLRGERSHVVDGRRLRTTHSAHLLRGADRARAHA